MIGAQSTGNLKLSLMKPNGVANGGDEETGKLLSHNSLAKDQLHKEQLQLESRATICGLPVQLVAGLCYCVGEPPSAALPLDQTGILKPGWCNPRPSRGWEAKQLS